MTNKPTPSAPVLPPLPEPAGFALVQSFGGTEDRLLSSTYDPDSAAYSANQVQAYALKAIEAVQGDAWQDIETAPEGELVTVFWLVNEDPENPERYMFDYFEEGVWQNFFNEHEHRLIAGAARGRSEDAPYTHWRPLGKPAIAAKDAK